MPTDLRWCILAVALLMVGCQTAPAPRKSYKVEPPVYTPPARPPAQLAPVPAPAPPKPAVPEVEAECRKWLGTPYKLGGNSRAGVDCSGFALQIYKKVYGVSLPRTAAEQFKVGRSIPSREVKPGDLLFFQTSNAAPVTHVAIYLGEGRFVHASTARGVIISSFKDTYYSLRYRGAKRVGR